VDVQPARDTDRLATVGQRVVGFLADTALAGFVLATPGILARGAVDFDDLSPGVLSLLAIAGFLFLALYEIVPIALWGRTPGKVVVGTRVVGMDDGRVPGWKRSLLRWALPALAWRIKVVGWVLPLVLRGTLVTDPLRQGVHDKLAGTIVVKA
jgi:uncharacterized RDD family membrane protein YckC